MSIARPSNKSNWALYFSLITLRLFGAIYSLPGYIHPDEFFQSGQELFFGQQLNLSKNASVLQYNYTVRNVPWEFEQKNAVRSFVPSIFMTLVPLRSYDFIKKLLTTSAESAECKSTSTPELYSVSLAKPIYHLSGREILIIPRVFITFLSLIFLDGSLCFLIFIKYERSDHRKLSDMMYFMYQRGPPIEVLILASSWPCLVFGIRPFTNTLEAMCLSILLVLVNLEITRIQNTKCNLLGPVFVGMICSIGLFVRFTFAFFAFPSVLVLLWHKWKRRRDLRYFICVIAWISAAFIATSAIFILIDAQYYSSQVDDGHANKNSADIWRYIAPLNSFLYNSKSTNLAEHGLHPRVTHALVNMPMLFGPLVIFWYGSIFQLISKKNRNYSAKSQTSSMIDMTCHLTIFCGLAVLSCAPHQEPRFILPCLVPLVLLTGKSALGVDSYFMSGGKSTILTTLWIVFNIILYIFFGWLHQGGLIDTLLFHTATTPNNHMTPATHIFYKTYMPPSFLARKPIGFSDEIECQIDYATRDSNTCTNNELQHCVPEYSQPNQMILDLKGNDSLILLDTLENHLPCQESEDETSFPIYLITPPSVANSLAAQQESQSKSEDIVWEKYNLRKNYASQHIHVSTEDWPVWDGSLMRFIDQLQLVVYEVTCKQ